MATKLTFAFLLLAALAVLASYTEAHSWADCIDWKFNNPKKQDWSDKGGKCTGYARRFPLGLKFASHDRISDSRHFMQFKKNPSGTMPCSNGKPKSGDEIGANESLASPASKAYGGKYGRMTVTHVGDTLCVRWPAKNHAKKNEPNNRVQINLSKVRNGKDISQRELLKNTIALLPFKNCMSGKNEDTRACGGCFKVPTRASGIYLLQWRWMLNKNEWYTSCADIQIGKK